MSIPFPTVEQVETCENVEECLRWNRFLPSPAVMKDGQINEAQVEVIDAVISRLRVLRARDNEAYVRASKNLGW